MTFEFEGKPYVIEFSRSYKEGFNSRWPYTTVTVSEIVSPQVTRVVRTYSVGCYFKDQFDSETGRKAALKMALFDDPRAPKNPMALPKEFKTLAWDAYFRRWKDGKHRVRANDNGRD